MLTCDRTGCENRAAYAIWLCNTVVLECFGHGRDTLKRAPRLKYETVKKADHEQAAQEKMQEPDTGKEE